MSGLLVISNGYGEDSFTSILLDRLMDIMDEKGINLPVFLLPIVGDGKAFAPLLSAYPDSVSLLFHPSQRQYGGLYLGSFGERTGRMAREFWNWGKKDLRVLARTLRGIRPRIRYQISVGDAIPPLINTLFLRKTHFMVAMAHTSLLKKSNRPYERLGPLTAYLYRTFCQRVYTRDSQTARWFQSLGIPATYLGFLGPNIKPSPGTKNTVLLLPGSRQDWKENFYFLNEVLASLSGDTVSRFHFHYVFSPGLPSPEIPVLISQASLPNVTWSQGDYLKLLSDSAMVVGFAGSALEQAAFLGIPSIGPFRPGAIQANPDFMFNRQTLLLREAFLCGGNSPMEGGIILADALSRLPELRARAERFSLTTWEGLHNGSENIARDIISAIQEDSGIPQSESSSSWSKA
ncbi:MAG TPA: hypothetical protein VLH40_03165 [Atribacteraceae bacterium]|nr:hypothetical protein [Atribacteraceae bacterium]